MKTQIQTDIIAFLESLVHKRYSMEQLNEELSKVLKEKIEVENNTKIRLESKDFDVEEDLPFDWNLMFNSKNESTYGYFDIYMLPMRRTGFNGGNMYITEVGYEFE
jgi:hypothetical protein